jgi:hypothetical protein
MSLDPMASRRSSCTRRTTLSKLKSVFPLILFGFLVLELHKFWLDEVMSSKRLLYPVEAFLRCIFLYPASYSVRWQVLPI